MSRLRRIAFGQADPDRVDSAINLKCHGKVPRKKGESYHVSFKVKDVEQSLVRSRRRSQLIDKQSRKVRKREGGFPASQTLTAFCSIDPGGLNSTRNQVQGSIPSGSGRTSSKQAIKRVISSESDGSRPELLTDLSGGLVIYQARYQL
jgi:hypothetical protein